MPIHDVVRWYSVPTDNIVAVKGPFKSKLGQSIDLRKAGIELEELDFGVGAHDFVGALNLIVRQLEFLVDESF